MSDQPDIETVRAELKAAGIDLEKTHRPVLMAMIKMHNEIARLKEIVGKLPALYARSDRPLVVCLCGSTRFGETFFRKSWELSRQGHIVLNIDFCPPDEVDSDGGHGAERLGQDIADQLDELHKRKIDLADWIMILNVGGYVGDSTSSEVEYALALGKRIEWLEPDNIPDRYSTQAAAEAAREGVVR